MSNKIGFWGSKSEPDLPIPVVGDHDNTKICDLLLKKEKSAKVTFYKGWSTCRICGKPNGSREFSASSYTWPEGLMHYLKDHQIEPPQELFALLKIEKDGSARSS